MFCLRVIMVHLKILIGFVFYVFEKCNNVIMPVMRLHLFKKTKYLYSVLCTQDENCFKRCIIVLLRIYGYAYQAAIVLLYVGP